MVDKFDLGRVAEPCTTARVLELDPRGSDVRPDKREPKRRRGTDRRSVLLGVSAIAQSPLLGAVHAEAKAEPEQADTGHLRYAETDHIREFYARSRF